MSRGFTQDGDSGEFQPPYEDNMEDFLSSLSEIADLLRKANEQDQSLTTRLAFLSQEVETEIARTEALKNEVEELDQLRPGENCTIPTHWSLFKVKLRS